MYGESPVSRAKRRRADGLSPRVRGILTVDACASPLNGSIPACTGNPSALSARAFELWVYPRVYGESDHLTAVRQRAMGLSPRVRGIRLRPRHRQSASGSIPACTGNPWTARRCSPRLEVYPRVYGESLDPKKHYTGEGGLSPRVRGILFGLGDEQPRSRSIPACTGNPQRSNG